jgi:tRNA threonylcarbamoyladenosine biosynthesis protein TsaB
LSDRLAPVLQTVRQDVRPRAAQIAGLAAPAFARGEGMPPEAAFPVYIRNKVALTVAERA